ncbi:MAG: FHA domain-containing protein [Potamolinea sp.]
MNSAPLRIQLSWDDPATGDSVKPLLSLPIALGRDFNQMPSQMQGHPVSRMVLNSMEVSRFHMLIEQHNGSLVIIDQNSRNGTFVNGTRVAANSSTPLADGDLLQIGPYQITVNFSASTQTVPPSGNSQIFFNPTTQLPDPNQPSPVSLQGLSSQQKTNFPPPIFQAKKLTYKTFMQRDYL